METTAGGVVAETSRRSVVCGARDGRGKWGCAVRLLGF